jgi:predicted RNA-binding protein (virulence factor B family)
MLVLGQINSLTVLRSTSVGLFLGDEDGNDVLLPNKYVDQVMSIGDTIDVFVYKDFEQRWVATTLTPFIQANEFGYLRVRHATEMGAFLECGLEKDVFVPFKEQTQKMLAGHKYVVYLYVDKQTERLVASAKINRFLNNETLTVDAGDEVNLLIFETTPLGYNAIINKQHKGLIYHNEIFQDVQIGDELKGYIKAIREDHTIDISLQPKGRQRLEEGAETILMYLNKHKGFLPLHDKSDAEDITRLLKMSKKTFKKSVGTLYKARLVKLEENGVRLI